MVYSLNQEVDEDEVLHRGVIPSPAFWKAAEGRPSSAIFKDSRGVSVDVNCKRPDSVVKQQLLLANPEFRGEARIRAALCCEVGCNALHDPTENNEYHSLIVGKLGRKKPALTKSQAKQLTNQSTFVEY